MVREAVSLIGTHKHHGRDQMLGHHHRTGLTWEDKVSTDPTLSLLCQILKYPQIQNLTALKVPILQS